VLYREGALHMQLKGIKTTTIVLGSENNWHPVMHVSPQCIVVVVRIVHVAAGCHLGRARGPTLLRTRGMPVCDNNREYEQRLEQARSCC
jgi:hypothetical protein